MVDLTAARWGFESVKLMWIIIPVTIILIGVYLYIWKKERESKADNRLTWRGGLILLIMLFLVVVILYVRTQSPCRRCLFCETGECFNCLDLHKKMYPEVYNKDIDIEILNFSEYEKYLSNQTENNQNSSVDSFS